VAAGGLGDVDGQSPHPVDVSDDGDRGDHRSEITRERAFQGEQLHGAVLAASLISFRLSALESASSAGSSEAVNRALEALSIMDDHRVAHDDEVMGEVVEVVTVGDTHAPTS
jgi:hypothetical protein